MEVTFVLPGIRINPAGGYKVIFEYANLLVNNNCKVNIVFVENLKNKKKITVKQKIKYIYHVLFDKKNPKWFELNGKINLFHYLHPDKIKLPNANYIFATAAETAQVVREASLKKGKKYYFIQSYEDWSIPEEELIKTWKMPMQKIVISKALLKKAHELGEQATYVPNGLSHDEFFIDSSIKKEKNTLMMLYHSNENVKQSNKALNKLCELKKSNPEINLILFSTLTKPEHIPKWVEYYQLPDKKLLRELYNRATLFIAPSAIEGWALPPAEAMMCGTAVCATKIDGHEYVTEDETGYLINPDLSNLVQKVQDILDDNIKLEQISKNGTEYIRQFTWEKSKQLLLLQLMK